MSLSQKGKILLAVTGFDPAVWASGAGSRGSRPGGDRGAGRPGRCGCRLCGRVETAAGCARRVAQPEGDLLDRRRCRPHLLRRCGTACAGGARGRRGFDRADEPSMSSGKCSTITARARSTAASRRASSGMRTGSSRRRAMSPWVFSVSANLAATLPASLRCSASGSPDGAVQQRRLRGSKPIRAMPVSAIFLPQATSSSACCR